jgi:hypothetical protein
MGKRSGARKQRLARPSFRHGDTGALSWRRFVVSKFDKVLLQRFALLSVQRDRHALSIHCDDLLA